MKTLIKLLLIACICGCTSTKKESPDFSSLGMMKDSDYVDHLSSLGIGYSENTEVKLIKLNLETKVYLNSIYNRILSNNEIILNSVHNFDLKIINNKTPFIFSLPKSQIYISSGLIEKYLKSEEVFISALAQEIVKSVRQIYEKRIIIPVGAYSAEKIISLTRIKPEIKEKLNELTYVVLKRAGYDPTAFLNWIQIQNRNTLDFSFQLGDSFGISKEEHQFKSFLSRQGLLTIEKKITESNSSKPFYELLKNIEREK